MPPASTTADWRPLAGPLAAEVRGAGPRIVFVHGFTQTGRSWKPVADRFAALGHEVVIIDLPGHGGSGMARADLRTSADLLGQTAGPATYIGYSLGGRVVLHLAVMSPHIVDRVVVIGATPGLNDEAERAVRRTSDERFARQILEIGVARFLDAWVDQAVFGGATLAEDELADRRRNTPEGLAASLRLCGTGSQLPLWESLSGINLPVLALAGEHDAKFLPIAERIAASVRDGAFATILGAGHAAHLQQGAQVAARIELWLRKGRGARNLGQLSC